MNWRLSSFIFAILALNLQSCRSKPTRSELPLEPLPSEIASASRSNIEASSEAKDPALAPSSDEIELHDPIAQLLQPWWQGWIPELDQTLDQMNNHNLALLQQNAQLDILRYQNNIVEANGQPRLNASAKWTETQNRGKDTRDQSNHSPSIGFLASWEIDLWGRLKSERQTAHLQVQWAQFQKEQIQHSLASEMVKAWINFAALSTQEGLLKQQIEGQRALLDLTESRMRQGLSNAQELWQQRESLYALQKALAPLANQQKLLSSSIQLLSGAELNTSLALPKPEGMFERKNPFPSSIPSQILSGHPSVKMAWNRLLQADEYQHQIKTLRYPSLSLSASAMLTASQHENLFQNWINQLAATLLLPIFDGEQRKNNLSMAQVKVQAALLNYRDAVRQSYIEIEQSLGQAQQIQAALEWQTQEYSAQQHILREAEQRSSMAQESASNVWRFRQSCYVSERQLQQKKAELLLAYVAIQKTLGPPLSPLKPNEQ